MKSYLLLPISFLLSLFLAACASSIESTITPVLAQTATLQPSSTPTLMPTLGETAVITLIPSANEN